MRRRLTRDDGIRRREYELGRGRFAYPGFSRAMVGQVEEVLSCVGCAVRWERGMRTVVVVRDCPAHDWGRLERLRQWALELHAGQVDRQGAPYADHLLAVEGAVRPPAKAVALFHDALEDERVEEDVLASRLAPAEFQAVELVTRWINDPYERFIDRIAGAEGLPGLLAREVKRADVKHNLGRLTPELEGLRPRYVRALEQLSPRAP